MNKFTKNLLSFGLATVFTFASAGLAAAECADYIQGVSSSGSTSYWCESTGSGGGWCYYSCSCTGTPDNCRALYELNGLYDA